MHIIISGYGKMGKVIESILQAKKVDYTISEDVRSIDTIIASESVCIDFTTPEAIKQNYKFLAENFKTTIIGTTGWEDIKDELTNCFRQKGKTLIYASNFSIGMNIFFKIAEMASGFVSSLADYDAYLLEFHHTQKLDTPSGTAKTIARIVAKQMGNPPDVKSIRAGSIPGIHELGFESEIDRITIRHEAFSRNGFAEGAVTAALWSEDINGVYEFNELLETKFKEIISKIFIKQ